MARQATKAAGNMYYEARIRAAKYNEKLLTRAGAAEELPGVTEDSLKKYELDLTRTPNTVVALMADAYNAPELINQYCAEECPLGKNCRSMEEMPAERALLRLQNSIDGVSRNAKRLAEIMDDGKVDEGELGELPDIREALLEARRRTDEILVIVERISKRKEF